MHARALHLQEQRSRMVLIAISFTLGVLSSVTSGWLWWKFGGWVADQDRTAVTHRRARHFVFSVVAGGCNRRVMLAFPDARAGRKIDGGLAREHEGGNQ